MPLTPAGDAARVAALHRLGVLDAPPAPDLDAVTRLAAFVAGTPFASINLVDADRQWQASVSGGPRGEVPRAESMCDVTVAADEVVHVPDASDDPRFRTNPFVTGRHDVVRLYCGVPVHDGEGYAVGTLCVTDPQVRELTDGQLGALRDLATQVEQLFELRRQHRQLVDVLAEVDHDARHDPLTGLANRRTLIDRLELGLARGRRSGVPPTVFFCDLDGFKAVNDRHGHDAGDRVLLTVASRLASAVREGDTVARWGGDELVVLCEDLQEGSREVVLSRLRAAVEQPVDLDGGDRTSVGLSVGIVQAGADQSAGEVVADADRRMYRDKAGRRSDP